MIYEHWKQVPRTQAAWPWLYFVPQEMACRGTGRLIVNRTFLDSLNGIRGRLGVSLFILSGYRSPYHNAKVGGAVFSRHLYADAADLSIINRDKFRMVELANDYGFTGFGYYRTFLHIDLGRKRSWGMEKWDA